MKRFILRMIIGPDEFRGGNAAALVDKKRLLADSIDSDRTRAAGSQAG